MDFYGVNFLFVLAILLPNLLFIFYKPKNIVTLENSKKVKILESFERIGQLGIFILPMFYDYQHHLIFFILLCFFLVFYYIVWFRYYLKGRNYHDLFSDFFIIPVPLALSPILYFLILSMLLNSYLLFIFNILFAIGHIPISILNEKSSDNKA